jgi:opacity protein-like surface antigen
MSHHLSRVAGPTLALLAGLVLTPSVAGAQGAPGDWRGLYLGGGGAYSTVSVEVDGDDDCYNDCDWWGGYPDYEEGDGAYGYSVHFGWRAHTYLAVEAAYLETGSIRWDENLVYMPEFDGFYNNRVDFTAQAAELSLLGILPMANWEIYLKLGVGLWDGESDQRLDESFGPGVVTRSVSESGTDFLAGAGIGITLAESWHVRVEFQTLTIDRKVLNARDDTGLDSILLELQYRFGAKGASVPPVAPVAPPIITP